MSFRPIRIAALTAATAAILAFSGTGASAAGWYWGAGVGWSSPEDPDVPGLTAEDGWVGAIRFGKCCTKGLRAELEGSYRTNDLEGFASGDMDVTALMFNIFYDFMPSSAISPYIGAGGGWAWADASAAATGITIDGDASALAGQLMAGVAFKVGPNANIDLGYRYFDTLGDDLTVTYSAPYAPLVQTVEEDFADHAIMLGFRWCWGAAPAPAPVAPPPPPPADQVFRIYFPWDVAELTEDARNTVREIATQFKDAPVSVIRIEGNTDTSGTSDYNMGLGAARAENVKAALIEDGIPESLISTESLGETNPAVETGDDVREPLNRRAEVIITLASQPGT